MNDNPMSDNPSASDDGEWTTVISKKHSRKAERASSVKQVKQVHRAKARPKVPSYLRNVLFSSEYDQPKPVETRLKSNSEMDSEFKSEIAPKLVPCISGDQDWGTTVLRRRGGSDTKSRRLAEQQAHREGRVISVQSGRQSNANHQYDWRRQGKLDRETEDFHHKQLDRKWSLKIQRARQSQGLSQKELAQKMNLPLGTVIQYEKGEAIPSGEILQKFQRALRF